MNLKDLMLGLDAPYLIDPPSGKLSGISIHHVTSDSRAVTSASLFVAITGLSADGHHYLSEVVRKGVPAVVVERKQKMPENVVQIQVADSRLALARLSAAFHGYPSREMCVVGVTGTNGKTTSTYLLESVFGARHLKCGVLGTINYRCLGHRFQTSHTTPEPTRFQAILREMKDHGITHVVAEVSSHGLALKRVDGTDFDVALFTNLTQDHLDFHKDWEEYYHAKKRLFTEILPASRKKNKISVINIDDPYGSRLYPEIRQGLVLTYALSDPGADIYAERADYSLEGMSATLRTSKGVIEIESQLMGQHNLSNILGVTAVALALDIPLETIEKGISDLKSVPGRFERVDAGQSFLTLVDYAHTPDALQNAGQALLKFKREKRMDRLITVFGCGGDRDRTKRPLMAKAAAAFSDVVIVTSDNPRTEDPERIIENIIAGLKEISFPVYSEQKKRGYMIQVDRKSAIAKAIELAGPTDAVLIAGKGHEDYQIVGQTKIHFDDREEARQAICLQLKKS